MLSAPFLLSKKELNEYQDRTGEEGIISDKLTNIKKSKKKKKKHKSFLTRHINVGNIDFKANEIEMILGKKTNRTDSFYFVKWKNHPIEHNTWVSPSQVREEDKIKIYKYDKGCLDNEDDNAELCNVGIPKENEGAEDKKNKETPVPQPAKISKPERPPTFKITEVSFKKDEEYLNLLPEKDFVPINTEEFPKKESFSLNNNDFSIKNQDFSIQNNDFLIESKIEKQPEEKRGSFLTDTPDKIVKSFLNDKGQKCMRVKWKKDKNGIEPKPTDYTEKEIENYDKVLLWRFRSSLKDKPKKKKIIKYDSFWDD